MGYVHDTAMSLFIGPEEVQQSAGTWTATVASNVWSTVRTAANAAWVTKIPIKLLANSVALKGSKLASIDIWFKIATEAMDSVAATIYLATLPADGAAYGAPAAQTFDYDTGHDAAEERVDVDEHKMTLTLDTPIWVDEDDEIYVELAGDGGASGVFTYYGVRANFTLRV